MDLYGYYKMTKSPCMNCPYRCIDSDACCFEVIMELPFVDSTPFDWGFPDDCIMLEQYELWLEDLEEDDEMVEQYSFMVEILKNRGVIK